jgi:phage terminase small subunit
MPESTRQHLTPKQEQFAQAYVESGYASTAYKRAYKADNMRESAVYTEASRLLDNPKVAARVQEIQDQHKRHWVVDRDKLTEMFMQAYELAVQKGDPAGITAAADKLGRLHGQMVDRSEVKDVTDDHVAAIEELANRKRNRLKVVDGGGEKG